MRQRVFLSHQSALSAIRVFRNDFPTFDLPRSVAEPSLDDIPHADLWNVLENSQRFCGSLLSKITRNHTPFHAEDAYSEMHVNMQRGSTPRAFGKQDKIHILVKDSSSRRKLHYTVSHVCDNLPAYSFCKLDDSIFVVSPELCFLQMADILPFAQLIKLGFELCGTYSLDSTDTRGFRDCTAVTSSRQLLLYLDNVKNVNGIKAARRAVRHLCDNSASPMETILAIILSLPRRFGGYSFPKPELNAKIELSDEGKKLLRQPYCRCDLYWPQHKLAVEYDSEQYHAEPNQIAKDSNRRVALALSGVRTITATNQQVGNYKLMDGLARLIAREMGRRERDHAFAFDDTKAHLRTSLLTSGEFAT